MSGQKIHHSLAPRAGLQRQNDGGDVGPIRGISRAERHDVPGRRSQRGQRSSYTKKLKCGSPPNTVETFKKRKRR
ncbi:hypothetical protein GBAR_LOCUS26024 [Geodia barretti]|uniref:Uncharacterized protein n=1 Tax=Geodia barretti TaxID=519541 RepID=A0AA35TEZ7_GEOBA|nr:hypothetical protein GBAR_LOCUS26024 [Geodia barretti]